MSVYYLFIEGFVFSYLNKRIFNLEGGLPLALKVN